MPSFDLSVKLVSQTNGICFGPSDFGAGLNTDTTQHFRNVHSGLCISPAGGSTAQAAPMVQYFCDGNPARLWTLAV